jgi:hypothetical protein
VVHGETGYLIPLGHRSGRADRARHTDRIFNDATLARRLGTTAVEQVQSRFGTESLIQQHLRAYSGAYQSS